MRILITFLLSSCCAMLGAAEDRPVSALFLGNSLTIYNDLPAMIAALAAAGGRPALTHDREVVGGSTLEAHWGRGAAQEKLRAGSYDLFVIQGSSTETIKDTASFMTHGKLFVAAAAERKVPALLYLTWARRGQGPKQELITKAYRDLAAGTGATIVPVGLAWELYRRNHDEAVLFSDAVHPSPLGTYLTACVFYATIYRLSPVGLSGAAAQLDPATAAGLQEAAWAVAKPAEAPKARR